jgi:polyhydroxybutyrate depolymerase
MKLGFVFLTGLLICLGLPRLGAAHPLYQGPFETNPEGTSRKAAHVYLPTQYADQGQWPLVIMLHGYTGTGDKEDSYLGLRFRVSHRGFILLVPEGTANSQGNQFWNATDFCCDFEHTRVDDSKYLLDLIKRVQSQYHVDPNRIYLFGHSNGGFMANRLACEQGEMFAGVASLAGVAFKDPSLCHSKEPISMLQIHAENDPTIKYEGAPEYPGAWETVEQWLGRDGCVNRPKVGSNLDLALSIPGIDATSLYWKSCRNNTQVALWTMKAFESKYHSPHVPLLSFGFTDLVLDFLFEQHR